MSINKGYLTAKTDKASDEVYTPEYAVLPIIKYLKSFEESLRHPVRVWCPFDTVRSKYVSILKQYGFDVIYSHIDNGGNFFFYEPEDYDVIISNPPFSIKDQILKRLFELDKPYAILLPVPALQGQKRFPYMKDIQYLGFDKRINFYRDLDFSEIQRGVSFGTAYFCRNFLPRDLIIEELEV